jgi:hypothetical protein
VSGRLIVEGSSAAGAGERRGVATTSVLASTGRPGSFVSLRKCSYPGCARHVWREFEPRQLEALGEELDVEYRARMQPVKPVSRARISRNQTAGNETS